MEASASPCYPLEDLDLGFDCDISDSESIASATSSTNENTVLLESLARILVDTVVDLNDDGTSLFATATGGNEVMGNVLPGDCTKALIHYDIPSRRRFPRQNKPDMRRDDYTVGWACALPIEPAAAQKMADEEYLGQDKHDNNLYSFRHMGEHNVGTACQPQGQTGTNASTAAVCAKEVLSVIPPAEVAQAGTVDETIQAASEISNDWNKSEAGRN